MKTASNATKYSKEIEECKNAFNIEHRLYNEDTYFIKFFKFPENHSQRIRNTDIKEIGKNFDKSICQRVIASLVTRHNGPNIPLNIIRNHVFGNLDVFHRFFYETLLESDSFNEMVRVCTKLNYHINDKDEENLIDQANSLRERFYDLVANNYRMSHKGSKSKIEKSKIVNIDMAQTSSILNSNNNQPVTQMPAPLCPPLQQTMQIFQMQQNHLPQQSYQDDPVEGNNENHSEEIHDIF